MTAPADPPGDPPGDRSDRPRDRLGRPLPRGDPRAVPGVPNRPDVPAATALADADAYLHEGMPFHAHEVLEQRWRCAPASQRDAWRALAQWAAGLTHAARGNPRGAAALVARAADGLAPVAADPAAAGLVGADGRVLDVAALVRDARAGAVVGALPPASAGLPWRDGD